MEDENEYKKLPTDDKCVHKLWKARVAGYEEAIKLFNQIDDEKSPEWNKYLGLIKKFVADSNAVAQEKGLEATLVFVENCANAGKTTGEVMAGIVTKAIAAPKTKTKDLALQITLMYVEIEKHEIVEEELLKGMEHKNPKVVAASTAALCTALKQFGNKVIAIKPMVKKIPVLLADRDKGVRDEMKALVVEMHRWIGAAIEPHIASLQAVQQQELRDAFSSTGTAQPTRYLRSQQNKVRDVPQDQAVDGVCDDDDNEAGGGDSAAVDPYDFMDPVEILSKLPKDFYEKLEAKKWQERKEALDALEALLKTAPKLEPGDYADLVRALKKVISKDSNVMLVALAGRLLGAVASGLRNKFQPYAVACVSAILEKFKEKKPNVVAALKEAIDAIYPCTNLEAIMEDMLAAFDNKNPSVKAEAALFLARALCRTQPAAFNKKLLKAYVAGLLKLLESADPSVRDAAAEALGTATKLVGEKNIAPHIGKIDNLKEQKIKEFADKAVIQVKVAGAKKEGKPKAAAPSARGDTRVTSAAPAAAKPAPKRAAGGAVKKPAGGGSKKAARGPASPPREQTLSPEEVDAKAEEIFPEDVIAGLGDSNWKNRLVAVQGFLSTAQGLSQSDCTAQLLFRILNKKPGLKDTNVQAMRARLDACKYITENFKVSTTAADCVLQDIVTKLGETSCSTIAAECLTAMAEACGLEYVAIEAMAFAMDTQKNPKVQSEVFNWLTQAIKEFGFNMKIAAFIAHSKKALSATNPTVRTAAVNFLGTLSLYVGPSLLTYFDSEKAATKQLISLELDKYANSTPPTPTRQIGVSKSDSKNSMVSETEEPYEDGEEAEGAAATPAEDARARTDIAPLITDALLAELNDKNWKVRNEALDKVKSIITTSSPIKATLGELPGALIARLLDSNSKLAQSALAICEALAAALGPRSKQHARTFFPHFFQALGDSKQWIRTAAVSCVEAWCAAAGPAAPLEGEMLLDALRAGSPVLRATLLAWLAAHLPQVPAKSFQREELSALLPLLYAGVEDRAADVRKAAADCVLPVMLHLGYEAMHKQLDKLKPGSKSVVQAVLDKARPNLPVQPLPTKGKKEESKGVKTGGAMKKEAEKKGAVAIKGKGIAKPASASNRGKKDDEDTSPLLPNNNAKNQRIVDDQKLKVLKWNFTTPREEFFELLKEQMNSAGCNKQLIANMFHSDFRYHLKAIEALSEDLVDNGSALMANLDLVLKWLTLRFFDTNPSVILKGLEYLSLVFQYLMDSDYTMAEYEANCFIPYLVIKVGDPKDTVRNGVKALFKQICVVYSVTKLFGYLMEGLKSKNARQRAECLECICHLIETYGSTVLPAGGGALRELARHIGDRDNAVRSAALNCVAGAYFLEGEKVYKMIGQISDKDLSLLEERIKRAGKSRSAETRRSMLVPLSASGKPLQPAAPLEEEPPRREISVDVPPTGDYEEEEEELAPPPVAVAPAAEPKLVTGPFGLDPALIAQLDAAVPHVSRAALTELDLKFLDEPVPAAALARRALPPAPRHTVAPSPPRHTSHPLMTPMTVTQSGPGDDSRLGDIIHSIASPDVNVAIRALSHISGVLVSGRGAALAAHEQRLVTSAAAQVRLLRTGPRDSQHALSAYKYIAGTLNTFYETGGCGAHVGEVALAALLGELLRVLGAGSAGGAGGGGGGDGERLARVLNNVCVRLLERSQHTPTLCAIISLLHESIGVSDPEYPRYQDLLLKCFWKTLKLLATWDVASIDYDAVLYKIHLFYKAYPNSYWKKNADISDTPYRTVKTLVHTLVKMKGASITNHLTLISDSNESDLYPYLLKVLKQLKLDDKKENTADVLNGGFAPQGGNSGNAALSAGRMPRGVHEELAAILKRIGTKEHNKEALSQLYDLRDRHPEVDIWTFMQGSSFYFRNYVERGLLEVGEQRKLAAMPYRHDFAMDKIDISNENEEKTHVIFLERLRALQAKAGIKQESSPTSQPRTPVGDNRTLADSVHESTLAMSRTAHSLDPQLQLHTNQPMSHKNEAAVDALRLKLQQIKSSSKR